MDKEQAKKLIEAMKEDNERDELYYKSAMWQYIAIGFLAGCAVSFIAVVLTTMVVL